MSLLYIVILFIILCTTARPTWTMTMMYPTKRIREKKNSQNSITPLNNSSYTRLTTRHDSLAMSKLAHRSDLYLRLATTYTHTSTYIHTHTDNIYVRTDTHSPLITVINRAQRRPSALCTRVCVVFVSHGDDCDCADDAQPPRAPRSVHGGHHHSVCRVLCPACGARRAACGVRCEERAAEPLQRTHSTITNEGNYNTKNSNRKTSNVCVLYMGMWSIICMWYVSVYVYIA